MIQLQFDYKLRKKEKEKEMKSIKELHFFHIYGSAFSIIDWERFLAILIDANVSDLIQSVGKEVLSIIQISLDSMLIMN